MTHTQAEKMAETNRIFGWPTACRWQDMSREVNTFATRWLKRKELPSPACPFARNSNHQGRYKHDSQKYVTRPKDLVKKKCRVSWRPSSVGLDVLFIFQSTKGYRRKIKFPWFNVKYVGYPFLTRTFHHKQR